MTPRKTSRPSRILGAALLSGTAIFFSQPAFSGVPVLDTKNIGESIKQVSTLKNQLTQLTDIRNLAQKQVDALGSFGSL